MRIVFVRHGKPDYVRDCLTEEGQRQAAAVAERLAREGIEAIYASPCGRAAETAAYTARMLKLPVTVLDYMREISWGGPGIPEAGHPWTLADRMLVENFDFSRQDWRQHPFFKDNVATGYCDRIAAQFDALLLAHGYRHEGRRFYCKTDRQETVALFSHGGSGACVLAHLLSLPFPYVLSALPYDFTSVTIVRLGVLPEGWVKARLELFNDCAHIRGRLGDPALQRVSTDRPVRADSSQTEKKPK